MVIVDYKTDLANGLNWSGAGLITVGRVLVYAAAMADIFRPAGEGGLLPFRTKRPGEKYI